MPPIWKILIISVLCLGIAPSWGDPTPQARLFPQGGLEQGEVVTEVQLEMQSKDMPRLEDVMTEKVTEEDLQIGTMANKEVEETQEQPSVKKLAIETTPEVKTQKTSEPAQSVELSLEGFEHLGIKRLSPGISIFRFSHFYIKRLSPLARGKHLTDTAVE